MAIVNTDTGEPLVERMECLVEADLLKNKIDRDLDQMDAEMFAAEWGLPKRLGEGEKSN